MMAMHRSKAWKASWAGVALTLIAASTPALSAEETPQPITAVYKAKEISFHFRASGQFVACHELQQSIANILIGVGARDDVDVKLRNCDTFLMPEDNTMDPMSGRDSMDTLEDRWGTSSRFSRPGDRRDQTIQVRARVMMPVEVTPEILKELDKDKSRRELVSRVTGNPAAAFNEPIVFAAQRQEVTLSQRTIRLRPEDCEVLEQMATQVFRRLDVRVVRSNASCGRGQSRISPQLVAEALVPTGQLLPMPDPEKQKQSGSGPSAESAPKEAPPPAETPPQQ